MRAIESKTILITFTALSLLSLSGCSSLPGCWIFGFIWDACYEKDKPPCCRPEHFAGSYTGLAYGKPASGPYYWGGRLELNITPQSTNTNGESSCLNPITGTLLIEDKNPDTQKYEVSTRWKIHIACDEHTEKDTNIVPFHFQLKEYYSNTTQLEGEGKLWRDFGGQIDLRFNDGAGIVDIQVKRNP